jgi:5'-3' exonuclease
MIPPGIFSGRLLCLLDLSWWLSCAWYQALREVLGDVDPAQATEQHYRKAANKTIALVAGWIARLLSAPLPACVAVAVDTLGPTIRHEMTKGLPEERRYKAGRPARPVAYHRAANTVLEIVQLHAIPVLAAEGYEADDVIATASRLAVEAGLQVAIIAEDKDMAALVRGGAVWQWAWCGREGIEDIRGPTEIELRYGGRTSGGQWYGIAPELVPDWLAIVGDAADNVKGVEGLGELGAARVLMAASSGPIGASVGSPWDRGIDRALALELPEVSAEAVAEATKALKKIDNTKPNALSDEAIVRLCRKRAEAQAKVIELKEARLLWRLVAKLKAQREGVLLARDLVTLRDDCPIVWRPEELPVGGFDLEGLRALYHELGFHAMAAEVRSQPKRSLTDILRKEGI